MAQEVGVVREQQKWKFCTNGTVISVPTGWNGKGGVPPKAQCPFVPENFHLSRAFHLHFNRLDREFWLNGKRPSWVRESVATSKQIRTLS